MRDLPTIAGSPRRPVLMLVIALMLSLSLGHCVSDTAFNKSQTGEEDPPSDEPNTDPTPAPDEDSPPPAPDPGDTPDIDESEVRCNTTFNHQLKIAIDASGTTSDIAETALPDDYEMTVGVGSTSLALESENIPTYSWSLTADQTGSLPVTFTIKSSGDGTYYGLKDAASALLQLQDTVYTVEMSVEGLTTVYTDTVTIDLSTASSGGGSWEGTSARFVGTTTFPDAIATLATTYTDALMTVAIEGTFSEDPSAVDGSNCSGSTGGTTGSSEATLGSGLSFAIADPGYSVSAPTTEAVSMGVLQPNAVVARRFRLKHTGTSGVIPLTGLDFLFDDETAESRSGNFFFPDGAVEAFAGSLAVGESQDVVVLFNPMGMNPAPGTSMIDGDILYITTGSAELAEQERYLEVIGEVSYAAPPLAISAYEATGGAYLSHSVGATDTIAVPTGGGQVMLVFENVTTTSLTVTGLSLQSATADFYLDAQASAVENTVDGIDGFYAADCDTATNGESYANAANPCHLALTPTTAVSLPTTTLERTVMVRATLTNGSSSAASTATLTVTYNDSAGKAYSQTGSLVGK